MGKIRKQIFYLKNENKHGSTQWDQEELRVCILSIPFYFHIFAPKIIKQFRKLRGDSILTLSLARRASQQQFFLLIYLPQ